MNSGGTLIVELSPCPLDENQRYFSLYDSPYSSQNRMFLNSINYFGSYQIFCSWCAFKHLGYRWLAQQQLTVAVNSQEALKCQGF